MASGLETARAVETLREALDAGSTAVQYIDVAASVDRIDAGKRIVITYARMRWNPTRSYTCCSFFHLNDRFKRTYPHQG